MFLICAIKVTVLSILFCSTVILGEFTKSSSILSNDIHSISLSGDTLWAVTSHGVCFSTNLSEDTIIWFGNAEISANFVKNENGFAFLSIHDKSLTQDDFYIYNHSSLSGNLIKVPYNFDKLNEQKQDDQFKLRLFINDALLVDSTFWIAAYDGGLLKYDFLQEKLDLILPGEIILRDINTVSDALFPETPNPVKRVGSVAQANSNELWVGSLKCLWIFNISDTTWDSLGFPDSELGNFDSIVGLNTLSDDSNTVIVHFLRKKSNDTTGMSEGLLVQYNRLTAEWKKVNDNSYLVVESGSKNDIFASLWGFGSNLKRFSLDSLGIMKLSTSESVFKPRFDNAFGAPGNYSINDIAFSASGDSSILAIATSKGLFYSLDEYNDAIENISFRYIKRNVQLKRGLGETYSYPSIITGNADDGKDKAYFAYNLSKKAKVTIDIYDFNMDHVVRIIDEEIRGAGKDNPSGRSTDEEKDWWDGSVSNNGGNFVPPGVYYYRIKSDEGERAFGKVIVSVSKK